MVDDDEPIRNCVCAILEGRNLQTIQASNGFEALQLLDELGDTINLIISDIKMPGCDGVILALTVRELFPEMPLVLITGDKPAYQTFRNASFHLVSKPFTPATLLTSIEEAAMTSCRSATFNSYIEQATGSGTGHSFDN